MGWMAENIVKSVFFCFCLFFFFFVVLFLQNKCKLWKYRITKSQLQMGYMEKLWSLLVKNIQVMSPSEMKNSVSRITRLFFNYFYTK